MFKIKENFKKVIAVGVSMTMLFSMSLIGIHTQENDDEKENKTTQENKNEGLSKEELEILDELYEIDPNFTYEGELVSVSKTTQTNAPETKNNFSLDGLFKGYIKDNYMTIILTVTRVPDVKKDIFDIQATATWKITPTIRMQDVFAISWGDEFALESSTCEASYKGVGILNDKTSLLSMSGSGGLAYSVEASHYYGQVLDWVRINARITENDRTGITYLQAGYCHNIATISGSNAVIGESGIKFDAMGRIESKIEYTTFDY